MSLNVKIVCEMEAGYDLRLSVAHLAEQVEEELGDVLEHLEGLRQYGFTIRWTDGRWSLSKTGERLKLVLTQPPPRINGARKIA